MSVVCVIYPGGVQRIFLIFCANDPALPDYVVRHTRNYRLSGNSAAREAFRYIKKINITTKDDVSALDIICLDAMMTTTVDTLKYSSQSAVCNTSTPHGSQEDTTTGSI